MRRTLLVLLVACSSNSGGSLTYEQYETQALSTECAYLAKCGLFPDTSTCEQGYGSFIIVDDPSLMAAIDDGRVTFDGGKASQCLAQFAAESCDQTMSREDPSVCEHVISGTVGGGSACALDEECISQVCDIPSCELACCPGTCVGSNAPAPLATGSACSDDEQCIAGDYCDFQSGECQPYIAAGSACTDSFACALGYGCAGTPLICKALPGTGAACPDNVCANVGEHCGSGGTCIKDGLPGDSCATGSDCSEFFPCDASTLKCKQAPGLGEPCTGDCFAAGTFCTDALGSASPVCAPAGSDGATCTETNQCLSSHCDNGVCDTPATCD
ncbi:MAG TPA: Dickkopf N-terminal cysteine-rich domain-containing protein [Kofleriaceae bacterium]|jgi:hypothetical protein